MSIIVDVALPHNIEDTEVDELNGIRIGPYTFKTTKAGPPPPAAGGPVWGGIVIFVAGAVAVGFLEKLGEGIYGWLRKTLFGLKTKLLSASYYQFSINIKLDNAMAFFLFTNLDEDGFIIALKTAKEAFIANLPLITIQGGWFFFNFDTDRKTWVMKKRDYP